MYYSDIDGPVEAVQQALMIKGYTCHDDGPPTSNGLGGELNDESNCGFYWRKGNGGKSTRIIQRRVSMNPTRTLFSRMNGLASRRLLNDGNAIPLVGFGVYNTRPGKETEQSVLWALDVSSCCMPWPPTSMLPANPHCHAFIGWLSSY